MGGVMQLVILPGIDGYSAGYEVFKQKLQDKVAQPFGIYPNAKHSMVCLGQLLDELDVEVILIDYGNDANMNKQDYVDFVLEQVDPNQDVFIMGYSFGGLVSTLMAERELGFVKGYIILASFMSCPVRLVKYLGVNLLKKIAENDKVFDKIIKLYSPDDVSEDNFNEFVAYLKEFQLDLMFKRLSIIKEASPPSHIINVPTLCLHSKEDQLVGFKHADNFAKYYSDLSIREFYGDHMIFKTDKAGNYDEVRMEFLATEVFNFMLMTLFNERNA